MKCAVTVFACLLVGLSAVLADGSWAAEGSRPHIVFVLADDLGAGDLSCYGGQVVATPNLDRLAKEGVRLNHYYAAAPICSPSRCGLLTGQFPARWRITSFLQDRQGNRACEQADFLDPAAPTLPRVLQAAGYATAHVGKWHLGGGRDVRDAPKFSAYGYDEGVGTWESPEPHPEITATDWIWSEKDNVKRWDRTAFFVDKTLDFLARHPEQPCFVNLWLDDPHTPWVPQAQAGEELPKGATRKRLVGVLEEMDRQLGRLMKELPANTLLIFASDNGPLPTFKRDRTLDLRGSKLSLYEGGIRVPLIARWPGHIDAGRVDDGTVLGGVDVLPTLAAIAGAELPAGFASDGEDRSRVILASAGDSATATSNPRQKPLFWEYGRNERGFKFPAAADRSLPLAIRDGDWKLLLSPDGSQVELYNIASDPHESKDLAASQPEVTRRLRARALELWQTTSAAQ